MERETEDIESPEFKIGWLQGCLLCIAEWHPAAHKDVYWMLNRFSERFPRNMETDNGESDEAGQESGTNQQA